MSKPLNNYVLPTLGGIGVMLGVGYGAASRDYGASEIALLQDRNAQVEASAASMSEKATAAQSAAAAEAAKAADLAAELEAVKAKAAEETQAAGAAASEQVAAAQKAAEEAAAQKVAAAQKAADEAVAAAKAELEAVKAKAAADLAAAQAAGAEASEQGAAALAEAQAAAEAAAKEATETAAAAEAAEAEAAQVMTASAAASKAGGYGIGRAATEGEVAAWDLDVSPDGTGLPEGRGDVYTGEEVFAEKCAVCHGDFAEGRGNWPKLAGGDGTLADKDPLKTVGSYWPHLSTVWDYVHRSMPFGEAQSLSNDEVYAIVAYILYSNDLVDDEFELSHENFRDFEMPNKDGFIIDDRLTAEAHFVREPCMEGCKDAPAEITMRAAVLDVTPEEEGAGVAEAVSEEAGAAVEEPAEEAAATEAPAAVAALDPELVTAGEKVFKKCKACHQVGEGAKNKTGPQLNGVIGRALGAVDGFKYSKSMKAMGEEGALWDEAAMAAFLTKPKAYVPKTKMSFAGLKKEKDILAVTEYLKSFSQ